MIHAIFKSRRNVAFFLSVLFFTANMSTNVSLVLAAQSPDKITGVLQTKQPQRPQKENEKAEQTATPSNSSGIAEEQKTKPIRHTYTVTFDRNGGDAVAPENITEPTGSSILLPSYSGKVKDRVFVGWSTSRNANGPRNYTVPIYQPGDYFTVTENVKLYATWAQQDLDATFFIRLDGMVPTEPQPHSSSQYSRGLTVSDSIQYGTFMTESNGDGIHPYLNQIPSDQQLTAMWDKYDPIRHDVRWYVAKHENDGWHVDGILLDREKVSLSYQANCPSGEYVMAQAKSYPGFTWSPNHGDTASEGAISADGTLTLALYYERNSYPVTYNYKGDPPLGASPLPLEQSYRYGETVTVSQPAATDGYVFDGWNVEGMDPGITEFTMPPNPVSIQGQFYAKQDQIYNIHVYYQKEGNLN